MGTVPSFPRRPAWIQELLDMPDPLSRAGIFFGILFVVGFFSTAGLTFVAEEEIWEPSLGLALGSIGLMLVGWTGGTIAFIREQPKQEAAEVRIKEMIKEAGGKVPKLPSE